MVSLSALLAKATAISHATESDEKVSKAVLGLCPDGYPEKVDVSRVKGHYGNEIIVIRMRIKGSAKAERFLQGLWRRLSDHDRKMLLDEISNRIDPSGSMHIRIDKQELFGGKLMLNDSDPVKVEVKFGPGREASGSLVEQISRRLQALPSSGPET
jgi:RNA binding exosome subunit